MEHMLFRTWDDILVRDHGPLTFRLILQPTMATLLAIAAGWRDAREARPAFGWAVLSDPAHRYYLLRQGWKDVGKVFLLALVLDLIYQLLVFRWVYPGEMLLVATMLALVPYVSIRGPVARLARRLQPRQPQAYKDPARMTSETVAKAAPGTAEDLDHE